MEVPDLSRSASSAEYNSVIRSLEIAYGKKAEALMANCDVGVSLLLPKEQLKRIIAEEHHNYLESGCYIFECVFNRRLGVLPTTDKYAVVAVIRTSAPNDGKSTADIINWLRELEKEQPFELTGIGRDFLSGKFLTEIKQPMKLAKRLAKFCPDIFEPLDSIAQGAAEIQEKARTILMVGLRNPFPISRSDLSRDEPGRPARGYLRRLCGSPGFPQNLRFPREFFQLL